MKPIFSIKETKKTDRFQVQKFIELVDHEFYPPLSERGGGIPERVEKSLDTPEANYLIARLNDTDPSDPSDPSGGITGMIGCTINWKDMESAYINFLATHPDYRNCGISRILTGKLEEKLKKQGYRRVYLCTWSGNPAAIKLYQNMGYSPYSIVLNHRGNGINTLYFKKKI